MGGTHGHKQNANKKALMAGFVITTSYMIVEAIGGWLTNSLALLADAGHMLSDSVSLGVGAAAFILGEKAADTHKTYGYKRFEVLAALLNGVTLTLISLYIFYEASHRFAEPPEVASGGMLAIAVAGLIVNLLVAWLLNRKGDTKGNLNVRAAFLHVLGDIMGSVGAIAAALLIMFFSWGWADPLASVLVAVLVLVSGWRVTKDSLHVLMEGTPRNINLNEVKQVIESTPGVAGVHDLHVWSITSGQNALSCHAVVDGELSIRESEQLVQRIEQKLHEKNIGHATIQMESSEHPHEDSLVCSMREGHSPDSHTHPH